MTRLATVINKIIDIINTKQPALVSGENIKKLNGTDIVGSGNIPVKTVGGESILGDGNVGVKTINGETMIGSGDAEIVGTGTLSTTAQNIIGAINELDTDKAEQSDLTALTGRVGTAETDIVALDGRVTQAEAAVGTPLVASTVAGMTDNTKIYVYTGSETGYTSGNWYYWNGTAWTSGGVYNSTAFETDTTLALSGKAADSKIVGDELTDVKSALEPMIVDLYQLATIHGYIENDGSFSASEYWRRTDYINASIVGNNLKYKILTSNNITYIAFYDAQKTFISGYKYTGVGNIFYEGEQAIPDTAVYVVVANPASQIDNCYCNTVVSGFAEYEAISLVDKNIISIEQKVNASDLISINKLIGTDYTETASTVWNCSDYIEISPMLGKINYQFIGYSGLANISFYNANKEGIGYVQTSGSNNALYFGEVAIPSGCKYVRFCDLKSNVTGGNSKAEFSLSDSAVYFKLFQTSAEEVASKSVFVVDKNGNGDFTSLNNAVGQIDNDTALHPVTIIVNPGVYKECVNVDSSRYLSIVGVNRDECILRWDTGEYRNEPLIFEGTGLVQNMTIISTYDDVENPNPSDLVAYAVHVDDRQNAANRHQTFINCVMSSNGSAAIGIGLHQGESVELIDCVFYSHTPNTSSSKVNGALLCHSGAGANITGQKLLVKNCLAISDYSKAISITDALNTGGGEMEVTFINNMAYCYHPDSSIVNVTTPVAEGKFSGQGISLSPMSYGNNINAINS